MNDVTVREAVREDIPQMVEWLYAHKTVNEMDLQPFRDNQCRIFVVEDQTGILCYVPVQYLYMFGALAPRPDLAPFRLAKVCSAMTEHLRKQAVAENISTVILQPSDAKFSGFLQSELGYKLVTRETLQMKFDFSNTSTETA